MKPGQRDAVPVESVRAGPSETFLENRRLCVFYQDVNEVVRTACLPATTTSPRSNALPKLSAEAVAWNRAGVTELLCTPSGCVIRTERVRVLGFVQSYVRTFAAGLTRRDANAASPDPSKSIEPGSGIGVTSADREKRLCSACYAMQCVPEPRSEVRDS
jgi:hypothetical protein